MIEPKDALNRLRSANLLPPGAELDDEELAATVAECEQRLAVERDTAVAGSRVAEEALRRRPSLGPGGALHWSARSPWQRWSPLLLCLRWSTTQGA